MADPSPLAFHREAHVRFLRDFIYRLPDVYIGLETTSLTALYFAIVGLDILNELDSIDREKVIKFVYSLQLSSGQTSNPSGFSCCGFIGSHYLNHQSLYCTTITTTTNSSSSSQAASFQQLFQGNIAMTYTSLAILKTLGDDMSQLNRQSIITHLQQLQQSNGSFSIVVKDGESDTRFVYCACAISVLLNDWSGVDRDAAASFILSCLTYEGGISLYPGNCAHLQSCVA